ncbi:molybdopterin cofactor-binding domain-containing protein [Pendulispora albinea]|uniref:Xanthine dehydrogenase family protein molybdopterin-binding subunit n=1 Tax=Pendulispora albinea TaxID=2741071 RepID=A0ABZ2MCQ6_9BACT
MSERELSRRGFLQATSAAAAGLVITFHVPELARAAIAKPLPMPPANAFLRIGADDTVAVVIAHSEMGQGIWTGLAMMIAEELECDWSKVRPEHAPAAPVYAHPQWGVQSTGASTTTTGEFERYRTVGAIAKDMLVRAAAARWKVAPASCKVANGVITHGAHSFTFGQLAEEAMRLSPPASVKLKDPKDWKLLGTPVRRLDTPEKITGKAVFGMDIAFAGLRTAVVARPPAFGAKLVSFDGAAALRVPGVEKVVRIPNGVAVVAKHFWAAKTGRDALVCEWGKPEGGGVTSRALLADYRAQARKPGAIVVEAGKVDAALAGATSRHEVYYEFPYLAHAPMEPLNCTVKIDGDRCEIWTGTQGQTLDQNAAARILGIAPDKVQIHTPFLGGGFGRRGVPTSDFVSEAVHVAKAAGVPVKVVWTREDDIRGGYYRPAYVHRVQVGLDAKGMPVAWDHVIVGQSILAGTMLEPKNGLDHTSFEGVDASPYLEGLRAKRVSLHSPKTSVPVLWWRSVGATHTAFALESLVDELAHAAGQDPLAYRLALLRPKPRFAAVLQLAADKAGWGTALPAGRARGLAVHESFGSIIAQVVEISIADHRIQVHQVTCAVDCGTVINPLAVEAQVQGSIAFGLTAALHGELTLVEGRVQESNFHDYPPLRMFEMPKVSVHVVPSDARGRAMGGIGEPATAPIAPAVANAVFALTKQRLRKLPLRLASESLASEMPKP